MILETQIGRILKLYLKNNKMNTFFHQLTLIIIGINFFSLLFCKFNLALKDKTERITISNLNDRGNR